LEKEKEGLLAREKGSKRSPNKQNKTTYIDFQTKKGKQKKKTRQNTVGNPN
jgi:hypothetical protein